MCVCMPVLRAQLSVCMRKRAEASTGVQASLLRHWVDTSLEIDGEVW